MPFYVCTDSRGGTIFRYQGGSFTQCSKLKILMITVVNQYSLIIDTKIIYS